MKAFLALVALALIAAALYFVAVPQGDATDGLAPEGAPAQTTSTAAPVELAGGEALATNRSDVGAGSALAMDAATQEDALWVEGRVLLPEGVPADDSLEVFALAEQLDAAELASVLDPVFDLEVLAEHQLRGRRQRQAAVVARAAVATDGSFRLPFSATTRAGWVSVRGRHLYLGKAQPIDPRKGVEVNVTPEVGIWVTGTLSATAGSQGGFDNIPIRLTVDTSNVAGLGLAQAQISPTRMARSDANGQFSFRAAFPDMAFVVEALPQAEFAYVRTPLNASAPGSSVQVELQLDTGGRIRGHVVDSNGKAVEDALVVATRAGGAFGIEGSTVRQTESGPGGAFELLAVPVETLKLTADHIDYLQTTRQSVEVPPTKELEGVSLIVGKGKTISGFVRWSDGRPAAGVLVRADFDVSFGVGMQGMAASHGGKGETTSDGNGVFVVRGLGSGPFSLRASGETGGRARKDGVRPGQDGIELVLPPEIKVAGRVIDQEGAPVTQFSLHLARVNTGDIVSVTTNARRVDIKSDTGAFEVGDLVEGNWELQVQGDDLITGAPVKVQLPRPEGAEPLEIGLLRAASVSGRVLSPAGEPVAEARVFASDGAPGWQSMLTEAAFPPETRSGEEGEFTMTGIPPGGASLKAEHGDYAPSLSRSLDLAAGEERADVDLVLKQGGTITGEVIRPDGSPGAGYLINCNNVADQSILNSSSAADGTFQLDLVPSGTWQVVAIDQGADWSNSTADGAFDMAAIMKDILLGQAIVTDGETVHVILGSAPEDPVEVTGKVTENEQPAADSILSFIPDGARIYERIKLATVGEDGTYSVVLDQGGEYVINVQRRGATMTEQNTIEFSRRIPDAPQHRLDLALPLGRISGRVTDGSGRPAGGERVTLTVDGTARSDNLLGGQYAEVSTNADGSYDLPGLRPGVYRVSAGGAPPFTGEASDRLGRISIGGVTLGEDEWKKGMDISLPDPGSLEVTITDGTGTPLPGATLFVRDANGRILEPFSLLGSDGTGVASYSGIAPGEYTFSARIGTLTSSEAGPITVRSGQATRGALVLEPGTILWLRFTDGDRNPIAVNVSVVDEQGHEYSGMVGMADLQALYFDGEFSPAEHRLGPLPAGKYTVRANAGGLTAEKSVRLRGGDEKRLTVRLK